MVGVRMVIGSVGWRGWLGTVHGVCLRCCVQGAQRPGSRMADVRACVCACACVCVRVRVLCGGGEKAGYHTSSIQSEKVHEYFFPVKYPCPHAGRSRTPPELPAFAPGRHITMQSSSGGEGPLGGMGQSVDIPSTKVGGGLD